MATLRTIDGVLEQPERRLAYTAIYIIRMMKSDAHVLGRMALMDISGLKLVYRVFSKPDQTVND